MGVVLTKVTVKPAFLLGLPWPPRVAKKTTCRAKASAHTCNKPKGAQAHHALTTPELSIPKSVHIPDFHSWHFSPSPQPVQILFTQQCSPSSIRNTWVMLPTHSPCASLGIFTCKNLPCESGHAGHIRQASPSLVPALLRTAR